MGYGWSTFVHKLLYTKQQCPLQIYCRTYHDWLRHGLVWQFQCTGTYVWENLTKVSVQSMGIERSDPHQELYKSCSCYCQAHFNYITVKKVNFVELWMYKRLEMFQSGAKGGLPFNVGERCAHDLLSWVNHSLQLLKFQCIGIIIPGHDITSRDTFDSISVKVC